MIKLENFCKTYKSLFAKNEGVKDVSFSAGCGCITGLIGPNGAGKTTIIKAVCALHLPTSGKVWIQDRNGNMLNTDDNEFQIKRIVGCVSEKPVLYKNLTVYEYLNLMAEVWELNNKFEALEKTVFECNIEKVLMQKISSLSKGYRQRLSFAAALVHDPQILVLDEPSSGLDPAQIIEMRNLITNCAKTKTVLLSTHNMAEAQSICNKAVIICDGKLVANDSVNNIIKSAKTKNLEEAYVVLTKKGELK